MQIRVGIKEDDKDVICRAETELIMSQLKRKNTDITFKKYSIKQEERCNQSNSWLDAVSCAIADGVIDMGITDMKRLPNLQVHIYSCNVLLPFFLQQPHLYQVLLFRSLCLFH